MCKKYSVNCEKAKKLMKNNYSVYEHIFPNGKRYIGLTKQKPVARWGRSGNGYKSQYLYNYIQEFGWENIEHRIIKDGLTQEEAKQLEKDLIEKYNTIEDGYNRHPGGGVGGEAAQRIEYNGQLYNSNELAEMSTVEGIGPHDITSRLGHGWDIEDILTKDKTIKNRKYEYNGSLYTAKELAELSPVEGMTTGHMISRLNHHNWDVERAVNQPLDAKVQPFGLGEKIYEYNGEMYNTYELSQIHPELGLNSGHISTRLNHHKWSVERAITTPLKKIGVLYEYEGEQYNTHQLADLSPDPDIKYHDITDRLRQGWTVWEAVNIPKGIGRKCYYKNLK